MATVNGQYSVMRTQCRTRLFGDEARAASLLNRLRTGGNNG